jgi:hypothetical protein
MGDSVEKGEKVAELENASDRELSPGKTNEKDVAAAHISRIPIPAILQQYTKEERDALELKLKHKIDLRLMPSIIIMYILNYIDRYVLDSLPSLPRLQPPLTATVRNNIAAARLAGLTQDLKLKDVEFQTAVSILFVGYVFLSVSIKEAKCRLIRSLVTC